MEEDRQDSGSEKMLAEDLVRTFLLWIESVFSSPHLQRQIEGTPDLATERLIGYRGRGDSGLVETVTNGGYLTVKEVGKALWKSRERNRRG